VIGERFIVGFTALWLIPFSILWTMNGMLTEYELAKWIRVTRRPRVLWGYGNTFSGLMGM